MKHPRTATRELRDVQYWRYTVFASSQPDLLAVHAVATIEQCRVAERDAENEPFEDTAIRQVTTPLTLQ